MWYDALVLAGYVGAVVGTLLFFLSYGAQTGNIRTMGLWWSGIVFSWVVAAVCFIVAYGLGVGKFISTLGGH